MRTLEESELDLIAGGAKPPDGSTTSGLSAPPIVHGGITVAEGGSDSGGNP